MSIVPDLTALKAFALVKWRERQAEKGLPIPVDLSSACMFCALLAQMIHGGRIAAHEFHTWVDLDGTVIDLAEDSRDVAELSEGLVPTSAREYAETWGAEVYSDDPYDEDAEFTASADFRESLESCRPRVERWHAEWLRLTAADGLRPTTSEACS